MKNICLLCQIIKPISLFDYIWCIDKKWKRLQSKPIMSIRNAHRKITYFIFDQKFENLLSKILILSLEIKIPNKFNHLRLSVNCMALLFYNLRILWDGACVVWYIKTRWHYFISLDILNFIRNEHLLKNYKSKVWNHASTIPYNSNFIFTETVVKILLFKFEKGHRGKFQKMGQNFQNSINVSISF